MILVIVIGFGIINFWQILLLCIFHARNFVHCVQVVEEHFNALEFSKISRRLDYFDIGIIRNWRLFIICIFYSSRIHTYIHIVNDFWFALVRRTCVDVNPFWLALVNVNDFWSSLVHRTDMWITHLLSSYQTTRVTNLSRTLHKLCYLSF